MALKTFYVCSECGNKVSKWMGKCPNCGTWDSFVEDVEEEAPKSRQIRQPARAGGYSGFESSAVPLDNLETPAFMRSQTGYAEIDRVLGGGMVGSSVILLSGEPGIGKSTLLMQICGAMVSRGNKVLYVSGEESPGQLKMRAKRLAVSGTDFYIQTETSIEKIIGETERLSPDMLVIDSVQTVWCDGMSGMPGSVSQVREASGRFIALAKSKGFSVILVGHVNKDGGIAGPKVLEHMVDTVLHFEGEREEAYRVIRSVKNRFGPTNEIGVFEMTGEGLREVKNPSEALLAGRPNNVSGNCAVCVMEGTRPIIAEIQALVAPTVYPSPKRTSNGIDYNRLYVLLAVLEKRLGLRFSTCDTYLNVIGGLRLEDTAADLSTALSLISCIKDRPIADNVTAVGEIGLSGECRAVSSAEQRVKEAERLGFKKILIPSRNVGKGKLEQSRYQIELLPVRSVFDALTADIWN
ncbi:MAG: DNA repair protein RadA [Clostridia bacterium]|nr:DNA repair protein RadA [Clostridia bacterium]